MFSFAAEQRPSKFWLVTRPLVTCTLVTRRGLLRWQKKTKVKSKFQNKKHWFCSAKKAGFCFLALKTRKQKSYAFTASFAANIISIVITFSFFWKAKKNYLPFHKTINPKIKNFFLKIDIEGSEYEFFNQIIFPLFAISCDWSCIHWIEFTCLAH